MSPGKPGMRKKVRGTSNPEMMVLSINLPRVYVTVIDKWVEKGLVPSRSEFIRNATRKELEHEKELYYNFLHPLSVGDDPTLIRIPNGDGTYKIVTRIGEA